MRDWVFGVVCVGAADLLGLFCDEGGGKGASTVASGDLTSCN